MQKIKLKCFLTPQIYANYFEKTRVFLKNFFLHIFLRGFLVSSC